MDKDPKLKGTKAAAKFGAPYNRLMARRRGRPASNTRGGHNKKLSAPQDESLKDCIYMLQASGRAADRVAIQSTTTRLLYYETGDSEISVSSRCTKGWITRNSEFLKPLGAASRRT
jgi:hypothetical protein